LGGLDVSLYFDAKTLKPKKERCVMRRPAATALIWGILLTALIAGACGCNSTRTTHVETFVSDVQTWDCSGDGGSVVTATLKSNGTLVVNGTGAMANYDGAHVPAPWRDAKGDITSVAISDGVTTVGRGAFGDCAALATVQISGSVTSIGDFAFAGSATVTVPGSVAVIGTNALSRTAYIDVSEDNPSYSSIDGVLFNKEKTVLIQYPQGRQDTSYIVPSGVTSIGDEAFASSGNLTRVTVGNDVATIGAFAFAFCRKLESIIVSGSVTGIGGGAFAHSGLVSVTSLSPTPPRETEGGSPFLDIREDVCLFVPEDSMDAYRAAEYWQDLGCIRATN
jgi:hypothetical protein